MTKYKKIVLALLLVKLVILLKMAISKKMIVPKTKNVDG